MLFPKGALNVHLIVCLMGPFYNYVINWVIVPMPVNGGFHSVSKRPRTSPYPPERYIRTKQMPTLLN